MIQKKAYWISGELPIEVSKSTLYRWERLGLIKLIRVGAKTMITDAEIDRILSGKIPLPEHVSRHKSPRPKRGRPPKGQPPSG